MFLHAFCLLVFCISITVFLDTRSTKILHKESAGSHSHWAASSKHLSWDNIWHNISHIEPGKCDTLFINILRCICLIAYHNLSGILSPPSFTVLGFIGFSSLLHWANWAKWLAWPEFPCGSRFQRSRLKFLRVWTKGLKWNSRTCSYMHKVWNERSEIQKCYFRPLKNGALGKPFKTF